MKQKRIRTKKSCGNCLYRECGITNGPPQCVYYFAFQIWWTRIYDDNNVCKKWVSAD